MSDITDFWEARARRFAPEGDGLRAVCSYAMPRFYNRSIDWVQRCALRRVINAIPAEAEVLDYGCGVGRWTRAIARRGARVTALDFSNHMLAEAERRAARDGVRERCRFVRADVTNVDLGRRFDWILGVTVLQHVLDDEQLTRTIARLAAHLKPGGRLAVLEAAPSREHSRAETATFRARPLDAYLSRIEKAGLAIERVRGVDPAPFKLWVVPRYRSLPKPVALTALALASLAALPVDLTLAAALPHCSWHKLIVARAPGEVS